MRDLLRLIAIALVSFAIVAVAMLYSRGGDVRTELRAVADSVGDITGSIGASVPAPAETRLRIARHNPSAWVGLAGFPDQSEITFPIPRGAGYLGGTFVLTFDTQLAQHGDGLLSLAVNGTPRGQVVLDQGRQTHQVNIDLTPSDLIGDHITLQLSARGTTNSGQMCPTDAANSGSAITLTAQSYLELVADGPVTDKLGALIAAPAPYVLGLGDTAEQSAMAIWASQQVTRSGISARIGDARGSETALQVLPAISSAELPGDNVLIGQGDVDQLIALSGSVRHAPTSWPVSVADLGAETMVKNFRGSRRWTIDYQVADLPGGRLPNRLDLSLKTTTLAAGLDWVVRITLNGNLLESRRISGSSDALTFPVSLPAERSLPKNRLVIELVDTSPNEGVCRAGPDAQAQLLPETALVDSASSGDLPWAALIQTIAEADRVGLATSGTLTAPQAEAGATLLSQVLPREANMAFDGQGDVVLTIASRDGLAQAMANAPAGAAMQAILPGTGNANPIRVLGMPSAELGTALERLGPDDVIVLVTRA